MSENNDWTKFTKRINVNAAVGEIYKALATQEGIESWFLRKSEFIEPTNLKTIDRGEFVSKGDTYSWFWFGYSNEVNQKGEILEANDKDFLKFTFYDPMVVSIKIVTEENHNIVELTQENIPVDEDSKTNYFVGCGEGWTFYLANLKSILEGGVDLRNIDINIKGVINS